METFHLCEIDVVLSTIVGHKIFIISSIQFSLILKDKSGVGIIVDYSRDYAVVNGV